MAGEIQGTRIFIVKFTRTWNKTAKLTTLQFTMTEDQMQKVRSAIREDLDWLTFTDMDATEHMLRTYEVKYVTFREKT
jgi:hypothetical protein